MSTQTFKPSASLHLGSILFRDSETPVGVNAYGVTFEDACYCLEDDGEGMLESFEREVLSAMREGKTLGTFRGESWRYVGATSCHAIDTINA